VRRGWIVLGDVIEKEAGTLWDREGPMIELGMESSTYTTDINGGLLWDAVGRDR